MICFTIHLFCRGRFLPDKSDADAAAGMRKIIQSCYHSQRAVIYDKIQEHSQKIPFAYGKD